MNVSLAEIRERWTIDDLMDANAMLDVLEEAEARAHEKPRR